MSYHYIQSIDQMHEEIEETWEVRDLLDAIKRTGNYSRLRYNLDTILREVATNECLARQRDKQEYQAECLNQ